MSEWKSNYAEETNKMIAQCENVLKPYLVSYKGKTTHHIGSTSIIGLMGKNCPDFMVVTKGLLPNFPSTIIEQFAKMGWIYIGASPHCLNKYIDQWFHYFCTE